MLEADWRWMKREVRNEKSRGSGSRPSAENYTLTYSKVWNWRHSKALDQDIVTDLSRREVNFCIRSTQTLDTKLGWLYSLITEETRFLSSKRNYIDIRKHNIQSYCSPSDTMSLHNIQSYCSPSGTMSRPLFCNAKVQIWHREELCVPLGNCSPLFVRALELCESRGWRVESRRGLPVPNSPYGLRGQ